MIKNGLHGINVSYGKPVEKKQKIQQGACQFPPCELDSYDAQIFSPPHPSTTVSLPINGVKIPPCAQADSSKKFHAVDLEPRLGMQYGTGMGDDEYVEIRYQDRYTLAEVYKIDGKIDVHIVEPSKGRVYPFSKKQIDCAIQDAIAFLEPFGAD